MIDHEEILEALRARKSWEDRQATWYTMRHDGLRRTNKPWPKAADLHYPLADTLIEKQKPGYVQQVFSTDSVASFTGLQPGAQAYQTAAAQWFDYQLKQESNFEDELEIASDRMLQSGKAVLKVRWDADRERLTFEAINPIYLIVPAYTGKLSEADWIVHVQHYSKHAYKRLNRTNEPGGFDTSDATIKALTEGAPETTTYDRAKYEREGLTKPGKDTQIIVWEVFFRGNDGNWVIKTYSPSDPKRELRPQFGLPYHKGVFGQKMPPPPFFELNNELKDRGYYDPRGITERVAPFEAKLCKDWNTDSDWSTLTTQPTFYAKNGVPQTANLRMIPGQILPFELQAVQMPQAPADLPAKMLGTRQVAQELVGDLAWNTPSQAAPKDRKTATEVSLIGTEKDAGTNLRARRFRRELSAGLNIAWGILLQYRATALDFFYLDEMMQLPTEALGLNYRIELNGSGDNNNRGLVMQKAVARFQMFRGDPHIDQAELVKSVLEADDPKLVKRLLLNAGTQAAAQMEDQAQEITISLIGYPAEVRPTDDDAAHLRALLGFLDRRHQTAEPIGPEVLVLLAQHAQQHAAACAKKTPDAWKQLQPQIAGPMQQLQHAAQQAQQMLAARAQAQQQAATLPLPAPMPAQRMAA